MIEQIILNITKKASLCFCGALNLWSIIFGVQVSDTTKVNSSTVAGYIITHHKYS
jgi:hypothetical protein